MTVLTLGIEEIRCFVFCATLVLGYFSDSEGKYSDKKIGLKLFYFRDVCKWHARFKKYSYKENMAIKVFFV